MRKMSKKQNIILFIIFIVTLLIITLSASLAFFTHQRISYETNKNNVTSATMETLVFNAGDPINVNATSWNFGENMPSLVGKTEPSVTLIAGSEGRFASYKYNVDVHLDYNDFIYTVNNEAELLLVVHDPEGNLVMDCDNLEYKTIGAYAGFDITGKEGVFAISHDYVIETNTTVTQTWKFEIIFINYPIIQDVNRGKRLTGYIKVGQEGEKA